MGLRFTNKYTKLMNENLKFSEVNEELVKKILYSPKRKKDYVRIARGDGTVILWFRHEGIFEQIGMDMENDEKEPWFMVGGREKTFSFSDEMENYNIIVAEFWSNDKFDYEECKYFDEMSNAYFGIKEDDGRYSVYDVYSPSELGINVKY